LKVFIPEVQEPGSPELLRGIAEVKVGVEGKSYSEDDLAREMSDIEVVVITSQHRITRRVIERAPKLRAIIKYGSKPGLDNVDITAATERGIPVAYTPSGNSDSVAEFTVALTLALAKKLPIVVSRVKQNRWRDASCLGVELTNKTVGVVGLGVIGSKVAQMFSGLDVSVLASDPYVSDERALAVHARLVDLETLLIGSDIITLHAQLTDNTKHMIGKREIALMKRTSFLINTARGALIDEMALYQALQERRIAGAAIDAFETEPPSPDNPILQLDNVILTPHVASWTSDALRKEAFMAMDEVKRVVAGTKPLNLANPEVLGRT
jgi:D-3-phosphoglycerate dehydrogenase